VHFFFSLFLSFSFLDEDEDDADVSFPRNPKQERRRHRQQRHNIRLSRRNPHKTRFSDQSRRIRFQTTGRSSTTTALKQEVRKSKCQYQRRRWRVTSFLLTLIWYVVLLSFSTRWRSSTRSVIPTEEKEVMAILAAATNKCKKLPDNPSRISNSFISTCALGLAFPFPFALPFKHAITSAGTGGADTTDTIPIFHFS